MQKWEYLQIHVEFSKNKIVASANGKTVLDAKGPDMETELAKYLNSLGADGWELVNADSAIYPSSLSRREIHS